MAIAMAVAGWLATGAAAQVPGTDQPSGRLFDANTSVYDGRFNLSNRPYSPLLSGNPYATGNVRYLSLRSASPISDPTSFRAGLGSASLSTFRRDSVSVGDSGGYAGRFNQQLYFDPARSAPTVGSLSGYYSPEMIIGPYGTRTRAGPDAGMAQPLDLRLRYDPATGRAMQPAEPTVSGLQPRDVMAPPGSLFGLNRAPIQSPASAVDEQLAAARQAPARYAPPDTRVTGINAVANTGILGGIDSLGRPLDVADLTASQRPVDANGRATRVGPIPPLPAMPVPRMETSKAAPRPGPLPAPPVAVRKPLDETLLPGYDVYNDMRLALALKSDPRAEWFNDMQQAIKDNPGVAGKLQERAAKDAKSFLADLLNAPVTTFAGGGGSTVNNEMLKAESLLAIGNYYEAADRYEQARLMDPNNPLPLIGKGHALLAAGDYLSAAQALVRGVAEFPEISRFSLDLQRLIGGGEVVDIRRADILKQLKQRENPQLRFLLGYLEYHTGDREQGLNDLKKAAAEDATGGTISRYPEMLRGDGPLPVPKLPNLNPETQSRTRETPRPGARVSPPRAEQPSAGDADAGRGAAPTEQPGAPAAPPGDAPNPGEKP